MKLRERRRAGASLVDLTPLIDVVFLMLIFFMVSTSFDAAAQLRLQLPDSHAKPDRSPPRQLTVSIDAQGRLFVQGAPVSDKDLRRRILHAMQGDRSIPVVLQADAEARHRRVVLVMDTLQQLGVTKIGIATLSSEQRE